MTDAEELREVLEALRAAHFDAGGTACDYAGLDASPEKRRLAETLGSLQGFDPKRVRIGAQTAFWLNVFNAIVVRDAAELARARGPREVEHFFESARANIGGLAYSLDDIEHGLLRGNVPKFGGRRAPMRQDDPRRAYTPLAYDERMHFGLYCACRSSPPLHAFGAGKLDEQLEDATMEYLRREVRVEQQGARVILPRQFYWYAADFGGVRDALAFAVSRLEEDAADLVDRRRGKVKIRYAEFDWRL
ncbi:MAG TPA: DUF547 domain-containing protein, partial [Burkholderiales bacterium]|nr:DUF547 domain-containing protein [Burkholderiales bacterium]